jgi:hypothetical protein
MEKMRQNGKTRGNYEEIWLRQWCRKNGGAKKRGVHGVRWTRENVNEGRWEQEQTGEKIQCRWTCSLVIVNVH